MHTEENLKKKEIPCMISKKQVYQIWHNLSESRLRKICQHIQVEQNPHLSEKEAKRSHVLSPNETKSLVESLGVPEGYQYKNQ